MAKAGTRAFLYWVRDGSEAIAALKGEPPYNDRTVCPFPDIIFTDLKMPKTDGFEFLSWLKEHPTCAPIPTIVFSSSHILSDVLRAYNLGANAFIAKPMSIPELVLVLQTAIQFWKMCERPTVNPPCS